MNPGPEVALDGPVSDQPPGLEPELSTYMQRSSSANTERLFSKGFQGGSSNNKRGDIDREMEVISAEKIYGKPCCERGSGSGRPKSNKTSVL